MKEKTVHSAIASSPTLLQTGEGSCETEISISIFLKNKFQNLQYLKVPRFGGFQPAGWQVGRNAKAIFIHFIEIKCGPISKTHIYVYIRL